MEKIRITITQIITHPEMLTLMVAFSYQNYYIQNCNESMYLRFILTLCNKGRKIIICVAKRISVLRTHKPSKCQQNNKVGKKGLLSFLFRPSIFFDGEKMAGMY